MADTSRGFGHRIDGLKVLWERLNVADVIGAGEDHRQTVEAKSESSVRRRAILEGINEPAELLGDVFVAKTEKFEDLPLRVVVVDSYRRFLRFHRQLRIR